MSAEGLHVEDVKVKRGELEVVHGVTLKVPPGKVTVLLGANGAGKTSLLDAIAGVIPVDAGTVAIGGTPIHQLRRQHRSKRGLAYVEQEGRSSPISRWKRTSPWRCSGRHRRRGVRPVPRAHPAPKVESQMLSGGEQQMLVLARALVSRPTVLLIDELSQGLAPVIVRRLMPYVERAAESGIAVLLVEQFAPLALAIGDRAYVMNVGRVVIEEPAKELVEKPDLLRAADLTGEPIDADARRKEGNATPAPA